MGTIASGTEGLMEDASSRIRAFVDEVRRRKVARTGAAYALGTWVVWQVTDVISPALGWSDRVLSFVVVAAIALAPIVLALAWIFEIRPESARPEAPAGARSGVPPEGPAAPTAPERAPGLRPNPLAAAVPAALLSAVLVWLLWPTGVQGVGGFAEGDPTLISQCDNETDDPDLDGVLNTALDAVLGQSEYVSITSREKATAFALRYLGREAPVVIDRSLANELGVRWGYKAVIHCALRQVGGAFQVSTTLTDPQGPRDLAVVAESAESEAELVEAIDVVARRTRETLGESLPSVQESKPLASVTTSSLDALKFYTAGAVAERDGDLALAIQWFQRAAARDTLFARAHAAIGSYFYVQGNHPGGAESFRKALRSLDRVSDRDRVWIEATWASARGDQPGAVGFFREYLHQWPEDESAWYNLGTQHFRRGQCDEASVAFGRALALNPFNPQVHINLASCLAIAADYDSALVHYDSAFGMQPSWKSFANVNHEYGFVLLRAGDREGAERLFLEQAAADGEEWASGRRSAALLYMYEGRYGMAAPLLAEAALRRQALGQRLSEYRDRLYLTGVLRAMGRTTEADAELDRAVELTGAFYLNPSWLYNAVRLLVGTGQLDAARALAARAASDTLATAAGDQASVLMARAEVTAAMGQPGTALADVRLAGEIGANERVLALRCRLALQAQAGEEALQVCGQLVSELRAGWEIQEETLLAHFWLGRYVEQEGDTARAVALYGTLAERWRDADPGLVFRDLDGAMVDVLAETRSRLAALRRGGEGEGR